MKNETKKTSINKNYISNCETLDWLKIETRQSELPNNILESDITFVDVKEGDYALVDGVDYKFVNGAWLKVDDGE